MKTGKITIDNIPIPLYSLNTLVIGSGAAALNAAVSLIDLGQNDVAVATDNWGGGTSNNAGSDKQTYYKLSLSGAEPDSPLLMAEDLFNGGCMHGDIAMCEAQHSAEAFFHLVKLGVPFPHDAYGGYIGYKTDHDSRGRGTSTGPLTSHKMFEALAKDAQRKGIRIFDRHEVIALLTATDKGRKEVIGAIALDKNNLDSDNLGFVVFNAVNIVLGTGGPAAIYKASVYPESQTGSTGLALKAGATAQNLTESQFGLASIKFRWNVSGSYQQVIPRYISTDRSGGDEKEFLNDYFPDMSVLANVIFLKGYQWPFDPRKITNYGSSLIDLLVYNETVRKGRRVFLDYTRNPTGGGIFGEFSLDALDQEAYLYLKNSGALQDTPIRRLQSMNRPAIDLYKANGIDLETERLEIAVCAQHNNGGLKGDIWWESNIKHFFPVGEVNGTHGVYRPGGSALNSGQVGSLRAAMFIARRYNDTPPSQDQFAAMSQLKIWDVFSAAKRMLDRKTSLCNSQKNPLCHSRESGNSDVGITMTSELDSRFRGNDKADSQANNESKSPTAIIQERMSNCGAAVRNPKVVSQAVTEAWDLYRALIENIGVFIPAQLPEAFKILDLCLTHAVYLEAIDEYIKQGGKSRGSYLIPDIAGVKPCDVLGDEWRFRLNDEVSLTDSKILEIELDDDLVVQKRWVDVRPIPKTKTWFEKVWKQYREDNIIRQQQ